MQHTQETQVQSQDWEAPLEEGMATHSCILSWRFHMGRGAWQVMGSQRVGHDWATKCSTAQQAHVQAGGYGSALPHHLSLKAPLSKGRKSSSPIAIRLDHVTRFGQWNVLRNARCHLWAEAPRAIVWFHAHPFPMLGLQMEATPSAWVGSGWNSQSQPMICGWNEQERKFSCCKLLRFRGKAFLLLL